MHLELSERENPWVTSTLVLHELFLEFQKASDAAAAQEFFSLIQEMVGEIYPYNHKDLMSGILDPGSFQKSNSTAFHAMIMKNNHIFQVWSMNREFDRYFWLERIDPGSGKIK